MIGFLSGKIKLKKATESIIDVNGVGYLCKMSLLTSEKIGIAGDSVELFIHTNVREDDISLYAFINELEKEIFLKLVSVSGIGAKMALAVQSVFSAGELLHIVRTAQIHQLVKVPGVGKKTAERLILEVRDKFSRIISSEMSTETDKGGEVKISAGGIHEEAILALEALGFQRKKAESAVNDIINENTNLKIEELIRKALKAMK